MRVPMNTRSPTRIVSYTLRPGWRPRRTPTPPSWFTNVTPEVIVDVGAELDQVGLGAEVDHAGDADALADRAEVEHAHLLPLAEAAVAVEPQQLCATLLQQAHVRHAPARQLRGRRGRPTPPRRCRATARAATRRRCR